MTFALEGKHKKIVEGYNKISIQAKSVAKKDFGAKPVNNDIYSKTKSKSYENVIKTYFLDNELPEKILCIAHAITFIEPVFKNTKHYYTQEFLKKK